MRIGDESDYGLWPASRLWYPVPVNAVCQPTQEETLSSGGVALHVEHFVPAGPARLVLVTVHGFSAYCGIYRHVAGALLARGIAVTQFDCRGHGHSQGRRGHVERFDDYHEDLALVVRRARERTPGVPWALMGHSHGGAIALDHVLRQRSQPQADRLVLVAPWLALKMKVSMPKRAAAEVFSRLKPTLTIENGIKAEELSRNPEVVANFFRDPLIHHVATAGWFAEVLRTQAALRGMADQLQVPTLMLVAGQDRLVSTEASLAFAQAAGSAVEVRRYPDLYHEMFLEPERQQVLTDIGNWLVQPQA
jgi:alpha-beta hydrolase superfamily lysophospholipase